MCVIVPEAAEDSFLGGKCINGFDFAVNVSPGPKILDNELYQARSSLCLHLPVRSMSQGYAFVSVYIRTVRIIYTYTIYVLYVYV